MTDVREESGALIDAEAFIQNAALKRVELIQIFNGDWGVVLHPPWGGARLMTNSEKSVIAAALQFVLTSNAAFTANEKPT